MPSSPLRTQPVRAEPQRRQAIAAGVRVGVGFATVYSAFVLVMAVVRRSTTYESYGALTTWQVVAFYYAAGAIGGALFGLLKPWRTRYAGKFLTAYLLLFLVYGGGITLFRPIFDPPSERSLPLWFILAGVAILCLLLAPVYVAISDKSAPERRRPNDR